MALERRRFLRALGPVGASSLLAGCLGGDGPPTDGPAGGPPDSTETERPTDGRSRFPDYRWSLLEGADPVPTTRIVMTEFDFRPLVATMPPGSTVTVANEDSAGHDVTVPALGVKETLDGGEAVSFTVDDAGTYDYACEFHPPDMLGRLVVGPDAPSPTATPTAADTTDTGTAAGTRPGHF